MKTIVFLVSPSVDPAAAEKIKRRFYSEKVTSAYTQPGPEYESLAQAALGSRGFKVTVHPQLNLGDTPEKARDILRTLMGLNLGKVFVVFASKQFITNALQGNESTKAVEHDGSVTTILLTWERKVRVMDVDNISHLGE